MQPVTDKLACEIRRELPAALEAVEEFVMLFRHSCGGCLVESARFSAELVLREALTNAVVHGARSDPSRTVWCVIRIRPERILMGVADDGPGFDWRGASDAEMDSSARSGRGIVILRSYATRVRFSSKGNAVVIVKHL